MVCPFEDSFSPSIAKIHLTPIIRFSFFCTNGSHLARILLGGGGTDRSCAREFCWSWIEVQWRRVVGVKLSSQRLITTITMIRSRDEIRRCLCWIRLSWATWFVNRRDGHFKEMLWIRRILTLTRLSLQRILSGRCLRDRRIVLNIAGTSHWRVQSMTWTRIRVEIRVAQ